MTAHETLVAAKSHLLTYGWQKDALGGPGQPCCIGGAIIAVQPCESGAEAFQAIRNVIAPHWHQDFVSFNNFSATTFTDVIDAFDRAILATAPVETPEPVEALA